ncbi:uncharacterized protein [Arachis hypogaea]|uniref:uncharacterized protein n=1 Tax=Arachis hypogaea TaxID=3818 RepID=UPI003B2269DB
MPFPFAVRDRAKQCLHNLPKKSLDTWDKVVNKFLNKFFPPQRLTKLRTDVQTFMQGDNGSLYEAWERYKLMLRKCSPDMFSDWIRVHIFYEGLSNMAKMSLDNSACSSLHMKKMPEKANELIEMVANTQYLYSSKRTSWKKRGTEVDTVDAIKLLSQQLSLIMQKLSDTMVEPRRITLKKAGALDFTLQPYREKAKEWFYTQLEAVVTNWDSLRREFLDKFFPAEVTYRLRKEISCVIHGESETLYEQRTNHPKAIAKVSSSSETVVLTKTLGEMNNILKQLQLNQQQPPPPPQQQQRSPEDPSSREDIQVEDIVEVEDVEEGDEVQDAVEEEIAQLRNGVPKEDDAVREAIPIPFSHLAKRTKKQVELDPKMNKDKIHDLETIPFGSSISALMGAIPEKCGDPGLCMVTCTIGGVQLLTAPTLERSAAHFVLADKNIILVVGITEDVLERLTFPIDFYILEMPPSDSERPSSILLGKPFSKTSRFKLDAFSGTYSFDIDGRAVSFNLEEAMKHQPEDHSILQCDIIDETVAEVHQEAVEAKNMEQGASVGKSSKYVEDTLLPLMVLDDQVPSHE